MYVPCFLYLVTVDGHSGRIPFLAIVNNATKDTNVQNIRVSAFILLGLSSAVESLDDMTLFA